MSASGAAGSVDNALFEGLFCRALDVSGPLEEELRRLGYDRQRPVARYEGAVLAACVAEARRATYPALDEAEGLRQLGLRFVDGFRQTILGRVATTALPLLGPARFLPRLPGRFRSLRLDASVTVELLGPASARLQFVDPLPLAHFFGGAVEGALKLGGAKTPRVEVTPGTGGYALTATW